ncbi:sigma 54-interacting transcriptional regulator [Colwellia psychrerythraea]|uniref:HTH-type transcriptional regulatory protein TyrR n=1 Tax=Colwellia psychrerythraea TaxID=28229 RepID=A0A099KZW2_COLPS|nr:sigma 54-interacting transcriptional regulator [Colwellia psychrerythraea]KGJ95143.1 sigma-54 factor interaction domain-containing protein [Colwellia psychrerythraea]
MRIVIESNDRIGISQEILAVFAKQAWNLKAVEITSCFTYLHLEYDELTLSKIKFCLINIVGVISVEPISLLPSEQRASHLQALLDKMPEPIIDVDSQGLILAMNKASHKLIPKVAGFKSDSIATDYLGKPIDELIGKINTSMLTNTATSQAITIQGKAYILDISPVLANTLSNSSTDTFSHTEDNKVTQVTGSVLLLRSMNTLGRQISLLQSHQEHSFDNIIGKSSSISLIKEQGKRFAELDLPVLISGETGTGKELIARALHQASSRAKAPFLAINCSALPEHLLESELFGYESGAFTGAQRGGKPGLVELAEGGCLFLDEIAEMSPYLQAKLLRFLQDLTYRRVGGTKELIANIRIISASHQNLAKLINQKTFREDLYYRLNVLSIELPPLRERITDMSLLANLFIENAAKQVCNSQQINFVKPKLTAQALVLLQRFSWPGNIRQLQNVLFSVVALNRGGDISADDLQQVLQKHSANAVEVADVIMENVQDWSSAQSEFEAKLLTHLHPLFPTTRKLADRLKVSHNKIAMKLRQHGIK